jgi:hypothetical protein
MSLVHKFSGTPGQRIYAAVNMGGGGSSSREDEKRGEDVRQFSAAAVELAGKWASMYV